MRLRLSARDTAIAVVALAILAVLGWSMLAGRSGTRTAPRAAASPVPRPSATATAAETPAASGEVPFPLGVRDASGQTVLLKAPAKAIISHSPGATEILFAIGAGSQVIAADEFSDYPAAAKNLKRVKYTDPNPETELALQPDLVILATNQKAQVEPFRKLGLPVFYNAEPDGIDGVNTNIKLLGIMTGHRKEADALATQTATRIAAVAAQLADVQQGPKVFYELSDSLFTASPKTFIGGMLTALKAGNVAEGAASLFPQLTAEAVITAAPDVILFADAAHGGTPERARARPGWSAIPAVRDNRMFAINPDLVNRPGPRIVDGIEAMAKLLYPDRFR